MSSSIFSIRRMSVACVALTVACNGEPTAPRTAPPQQQPQRLTAVPPQDVVIAPTDDELARVAASVPAFGGMYFDRGGRLTVLPH